MTFVWWSVTLLALTNVALAAAIVGLRIRSEQRDRRNAAIEARWQPRLFALIACEVAAEDLADDVPEGDLGHLLELCGRFAQRLTGADLNRIEAFAGRFAWRLARRLREDDVDGRAKSVMLLSAIGGHRYEHSLKAALDDPDPVVAMVAAQAVAKHRMVEEIPRLVERVSALGVWSPAFVAGVVAAVGSAASPSLMQLLQSDECSTTERSTAALALTELRDPRAADAAVAVLKGDETDRELVTGCLRILEEVGQPKHLWPIRRLLDHDDFAVRARAAAALGALGTAADAETLGRLVADPSRWVALNAAVGLRRLHREDMLLVLAAGDDASAPIAAEALELEVVG